VARQAAEVGLNVCDLPILHLCKIAFWSTICCRAKTVLTSHMCFAPTKRRTEMPIDRSRIHKGMFLTGPAMPAATHLAKDDLADEFAAALAVASSAAAQGFGEIERRLTEAYKKLDELRAAVKR
jgi:hypothetical protein